MIYNFDVHVPTTYLHCTRTLYEHIQDVHNRRQFAFQEISIIPYALAMCLHFTAYGLLYIAWPHGTLFE